MLNMEDIVTVRTMGEKDVPFILDSIIKCLSNYHESIVKGMTKADTYRHLELLGLYTLNRIDTYSVFLLVHKDAPDRIVAYIIADPKENHIVFQYTKYDYRKMGLQKNFLMPLVVNFDECISVNWPTKCMLHLAEQKKVRIINKLLEKAIKDYNVCE